MSHHLEIHFLAGRKLALGKIGLYGLCTGLILFFVAKTIFNHEAVLASPNNEIFSEMRYAGYLQTSSTLLGLIQIRHQKTIAVRVGMHLWDCLIQQISPSALTLISKNGKTFLLKFAGEK